MADVLLVDRVQRRLLQREGVFDQSGEVGHGLLAAVRRIVVKTVQGSTRNSGAGCRCGPGVTGDLDADAELLGVATSIRMASAKWGLR